MPNPKLSAERVVSVNPDTDALHIKDSKGNIVGWIDNSGAPQGNLGTGSGGGSLQGNPVSPIPPGPNQVLAWNGTMWSPQPLPPPLPPNNLQGNPVSPAIPQINQALIWNGSAWAPGTVSGGSTINFADSETPAGIIDGNNATFSLLRSPSPALSLLLFMNGLLQRVDSDYSLLGNMITFINVPSPGDLLEAFYRF